ncbi:hypothetical protein [Formosa sp. A9]|uniref:hypothetical protein n=1 Tax=Formosa sp. A9 TaxID=3442641 RepID=UPI003EBFEF89
MNRYFKEKELSAIRGKIQRNLEQSNPVIRHKWTIIAIGIFVSFYVPVRRETLHHSIKVPDLPYYQTVILTVFIYTLMVTIGHFVWNYQDEKRLKQLQKREQELVALLENT